MSTGPPPPPTLDELLARNKVVAQTHTAPLLLGAVPEESRPKVENLIVTCADGRSEPNYFLALKPLESIVFRNMGGRVESLLSDILATDVLVQFKHIYLIHHTDCGATLLSDAEVRTALKRCPGADPKAVEAISLPVFTDDEKSVRDDLNFLKNSPLLRKELEVHGFLLDIRTALLKAVV